jgi:hypothetical protein
MIWLRKRAPAPMPNWRPLRSTRRTQLATVSVTGRAAALGGPAGRPSDLNGRAVSGALRSGPTPTSLGLRFFAWFPREEKWPGGALQTGNLEHNLLSPSWCQSAGNWRVIVLNRRAAFNLNG